MRYTLTGTPRRHAKNDCVLQSCIVQSSCSALSRTLPKAPVQGTPRRRLAGPTRPLAGGCAATVLGRCRRPHDASARRLRRRPAQHARERMVALGEAGQPHTPRSGTPRPGTSSSMLKPARMRLVAVSELPVWSQEGHTCVSSGEQCIMQNVDGVGGAQRRYDRGSRFAHMHAHTTAIARARWPLCLPQLGPAQAALRYACAILRKDGRQRAGRGAGCARGVC